jgi:uncharacterized membrane protein YbhN (UPF0104 family)
LATYGHQLDLSRFDGVTWTLVVVLAAIYGAANIFLAQAWWHLLRFLGVDVDRAWAVRTFGVSQLAKYVPGNVVHLAGRQALGMAAGLPSAALAKSVVWEVGLITLGDVLFVVLTTPLFWNDISASLSLAMFGAISAAVIFGLRRAVSPSVGVALFWQLTFLIVSGGVFVACLALVSPSALSVSSLSVICAAYVLAWFAGFVTPGAPAGVGVREVALMYLLNGQIESGNLLLAVVLGRMVTVAGDALFFVASLYGRSGRSGHPSHTS